MTTEFPVANAKVRFVQGDITEMQADAIADAANSSLMGGGGVDGAIHRRGGPRILEECKQIRAEKWPDGFPTGKAVITTGGNLEAQHVIHIVGPVWSDGMHGEPELLAEAYLESLWIAVSEGLKTIAFPSISTGAYGYPVELASRVALKTASAFLQKEDKLSEVTFVLFTVRDLEVYLEAAEEIL